MLFGPWVEASTMSIVISIAPEHTTVTGGVVVVVVTITLDIMRNTLQKEHFLY